MLRDEWEFDFPAADLAEAARTKCAHHEDRRKWWEDQKEKVMKEVKDTGIEVSESLAANYSNTSRGSGPQVMVRADLQTKLSECHTKILEHDNKAKIYAGWLQVLNDNSKLRLKLHADDYLFFFGK